jgi:hypothetical protein
MVEKICEEEMLVIPFDRVVGKKRIIGKMEGQGGDEAQWVATPPQKKKNSRPPINW